MAQRWRIIVVGIVVLWLAAMQQFAVLADDPETLTVTPTGPSPTTALEDRPTTDLEDDGADPTPTVTVLPEEATPTVLPEETAVLTPTAESLPTQTARVTATVVVLTDTTEMTPTLAVPTATPTPGADQRAVLVDESLGPVGGQATSQVFVALVDADRAVVSFEIHLFFDPEIIQVAEKDVLAVQTASPVDISEIDNEEGHIVLAMKVRDEALFHETATWDRVATITWAALAEGRSAILVGKETQFEAVDGEVLPAGPVYNGVVLARMPGSIQGQVSLQGRETFEGISVSGSLSGTRFDRESTDAEGVFVLTTSHGEGFYTVLVSKPGYLSAQSDRPVQVTVDSVVDIGTVTLLGGDVNGDDQVDIRDLSYVAWHFDEYDEKADINQDGQVDILDLTLTAGNFGKVGPTVWTVTVTESE